VCVYDSPPGIAVFPGVVRQHLRPISAKAFLAIFVAFRFQNIKPEYPIIVSYDSKEIVQAVENCYPRLLQAGFLPVGVASII
jgi:hypothetical protein